MYKLSAIIEKEGKVYVAHCVELEVTSQGKTIEKSIENLKEAVELYLKHADDEELARLKSTSLQQPLIATITVG